jgi:hypothetical protein
MSICFLFPVCGQGEADIMDSRMDPPGKSSVRMYPDKVWCRSTGARLGADAPGQNFVRIDRDNVWCGSTGIKFWCGSTGTMFVAKI